jgi:hypothetical protein
VVLLAATGHLFRPLLVVTAVAFAGWFALLEALAIATRPREPDAGPAGLVDVTSAAEPPAIANYLTNHWAVGDDAMAATLIDLAARHYLTIDELGPDRFVCRLARGPVTTETLTAYEQQMLERVKRLAVDGVVPCEALATGTQTDSAGWRKRFKEAVVADAKARGLSRSRWNTASYAVLGVAALGPAGAFGAVVAAAPTKASSGTSQHQSPVGAAIFVAIVAWVVLMAVMSGYRAERETPAGSEAAARWLGLREHLHSDPAFPGLPPAAVAIWDRYLSYGAALGVAAAAVHALPMGPESDHEAWSSYGGRWRVVHVSYPRLRRPGWGWHPAKALALSVLYAAAAVWIAGNLLPIFSKRWLADLRSTKLDWLWIVAVVIMGVFLGAMAYGGLAALELLIRGSEDMFSRRDVHGVVLRLRQFDDRHYVAVDENRASRLQAWRVTPEICSKLAQGEEVQGRVGDHLGHVWRLETLHPAVAPSTPGQPSAAAVHLAIDTTCRIDADDVRTVTGCQLTKLNQVGTPTLPVVSSKAQVLEWAAYEAAGEGRVMLGLLEGDESGERGLLGLFRWVPRRFFHPVPGVGDEAYWASNTTLFARQGRHISLAVVALKDVPADKRLEMARTFTTKLLEPTSQPAPG